MLEEWSSKLCIIGSQTTLCRQNHLSGMREVLIKVNKKNYACHLPKLKEGEAAEEMEVPSAVANWVKGEESRTDVLLYRQKGSHE